MVMLTVICRRYLRLSFCFTVCLMLLVLGYLVLYEMGPQTMPIHETSSVDTSIRNLQKIVGQANYLLEQIGLRDNTGSTNQTVKLMKTTSSSYTLRTLDNSIDEEFLEHIQSHIRNFSAINRISDEYANEKIYRHDDQYLQYMRCPSTVRKKMLDIKEMKETYVPDIPMLMWKKHIDKSEYQRLQQFKRIFGWFDMDYDVIAAALNLLNSINNQYLFDDRLADGHLPKNESTCIRCAVIGNGGILNGSKMGKEIDSNDYVFRVNTALTKGYEEDVGNRTSFYCFTPWTLVNTLVGSRKIGFTSPPDNDGIRYVFFADNFWTYKVLDAYLQGVKPPKSEGKYVRNAPKFPKKLTADNVKLVHPDFERYLKWAWVNSKHQHKDIHRPTTGGIMMLLALHTCDEVNAYGFGGSYEKYSEYYYDKTFRKHKNFANHDYNAENELWFHLDELGIINLYKRE